MMLNLSKYACAAGIVASAVAIAAPVPAFGTVLPATGDDSMVTWQRTIYPFSVTTDLRSAVAAAASSGVEISGFRFGTDQIVGEYSLRGEQTPDQFLEVFEALYGTQPTIVSAFTEEPTSSESKSAVTVRIADELGTGNLPFVAAVPTARPGVTGETGVAGTSQRSAPPASWVPANVYPGTFRVGPNSQIFTNMVEWTGTTSPANIPSYYAMEVEINLHNDATGIRGSTAPGQICGPNFRDQFIAKNYNWNSWSIYSNLGGLLSTYAYADLNDLFDSCGRNAMSIGFAFPQNIPTNALGGELYTTIDAQVGVTSSSRLSGNIGLIERHYSCGIASNPNTTNWTNCTGTFPDPNPPAVTDRSTLSVTRNWTAAYDKCWTSADYGLIAPVAFSCF